MNPREGRAAGNQEEAASGADAETPAALCELGRRHLEAGRTLDAQLCCQQALATDPGFAEAMHLMGLLSLRAEQADHAIEWFARAVQRDQKPVYLLSLGNTLKREGRLEDAFRALDKAVEIDVESPVAWKALAQLLAHLNRRNEAALSFQHILKLDPEDADAAYQAGVLLLREGKQEEALGFLDRSDRLRPNQAPTLRMRALAQLWQDRARFEQALSDMARTHALDGDIADLCNDVGEVHRRSGRHEEALTWFDKALALRPDLTLAHNNKACSLARLHRFDEALAIYAALKVTDPDSAEWNAALLHLLLGNFEAGWAGREARWRVPSLSLARYNFSRPMWLGKEPIGGKTILIYHDEGLGDTIQFARYVPMVAAEGARVILMVDDALVPLLANLPGVSRCVPRSVNQVLAFDVHCGITSLPLAFGTRLETIPSATPYLPAPEEARVRSWEQRLGPRQKLRVGLVWSGNPGHSDDHNRSIPLIALTPLLDVDATFVSLQKDPRPGDREFLARTGIIDLTAHLADFMETAALVSCLDLVITVDTSIAHLAGALACPTWILLPHTPDWRWLLGRDDSPWYPTVRLFRQDESRDYAAVIARVRAELCERMTFWSPNPPKGNAAPASPADPAPGLVATALAQINIPDDADSLHLMGLEALHQKQFDQAVEWLSRAIRSDPKPLYLTTLGTTLLRQGRHDEALLVFDKAVQLKPDDPELWKNLGLVLVEIGHQHLLAGRTHDAEVCCQQALAIDSGFAEAMHLMGLLSLRADQVDDAIAWFARAVEQEAKSRYLVGLGEALKRKGRVEEAFKAFDKAVEIDVESAEAWKPLAQMLADLNRHHEAALAFQHVLKLDPQDADAAHKAGFQYFRAGKPEDALAIIDRADSLRPDHVPILQVRALVIGSLGRLEEAVAELSRAHALAPDDADICNNIGVFLQRLGRQNEALTWFVNSLARKPDSDAAYQAGLLLFHSNRPEEALAHLDRADRLRPEHAPTLLLRALVIGNLGRFEDAVAQLSRAYALAPDDIDICNNMGAFLQRLGRDEEALTWFDRALARKPDFVSACNNKAFTLARLHRFDEALALYAASMAIDPNNAEAEWSASLLQLLTGNFEPGWAGREARWQVPNQPLAKYEFSRPMWLGREPINGKTILVYQDEGLGDAIHFARYVPMLVSFGARVILLVDDPLVPLLSELPGVFGCVPTSAQKSVSFDAHCAITSLALAFNTTLATIPAEVPYLPMPVESRRQIWNLRLGPHSRMRVGLVWSGNPKHRNDRDRSISLRALKPVLDLDATFVTLQKNPKPDDEAMLRERPDIVDLTVHLADLAETAALMSCLDLVITVDTSMAHLAGALARPTWILLPYTPDYRWMLDRDDSPWYPTARLFRQDKSRDYKGVIERVRSQLAEQIETRKAGQKQG